ncbi:MAG TPA: hypothetical protein VHD84_02785 [Candidatus Saccharimonadales bacterium]|nr:hypothetical protein [Candidatus Saccharimonadales bacterium]
MISLRKFNPTARAVGVISAVAILAGGVTFAALQSQTTLSDNTISSGTAGLLVRNAATGQGPAASVNGFAFTGVVPGGTSSNTGHFQLVNSGANDLSINVSMPNLPTWTVTPSGTVDNSKVGLRVVCTGPNGTFSVRDSLQDIQQNTADLTGATLAAGTTANCSARVAMAPSAFSGTNATSSAFDLTFTGTGTNM